MSAPEPPSGEGNEILPGEVLAVAGRVDALHQGVTDAQEALRRLASEPLALGSGQDNAAIGAWYRALVEEDTAPAAAGLAADLDAVRAALRSGTAAWEQADRAAADGYRTLGPEPGAR